MAKLRFGHDFADSSDFNDRAAGRDLPIKNREPSGKLFLDAQDSIVVRFCPLILHVPELLSKPIAQFLV